MPKNKSNDSSNQNASQQPSISQTMTNSPGGVQAINSNVSIHQAPQRRRLTEDQQSHLLTVLRSSPKGRIEVSALFGDSESNDFALQLEATLKSAGWITPGVDQSSFNRVPVGLVMRVHDRNNVPAGAGSLQRALLAVGFRVEAMPNENVPVDTIELIVGRHP